ncbi:hypothetical protein F3087_27930 [Nocardia colli]|uniref:Uncharacterized protein n=1 Tax=Nocardia colli TaxID=2545717 RepID=A0A5N0EAH0_9NOCA|nr:DUF6585 family protein [Nocardia colli]KAA8885469.1 hypothetical protein F3087_27930 [Nocardia colli]
MTDPAGSGVDLRAEIGRVAMREDLGSHRRAYAAAKPEIRRYVIEGVATLVAALVSVFGFVSGVAVVAIVGVTGMLMVGGRLLWDLLWLVYIHGRNRRVRLDLYERGLVVMVGGKARCVRYDTTVLRRNIVEHVDSPAANQVSYAYTLVDTVGDPIVLRHGIERPEEWGPEIDRAITAAQLPRAVEVLAADGCLDFEYFWMTRAEIGAGERSEPWSQVTGIALSAGWVSVGVAGESAPLESLPVSLIPNFTIFRTLAERMRAEHARSV